MLLRTVEQFVELYDIYVGRCENTKTLVRRNVWIDHKGKEYYTPISDSDIDLGISPSYRGTRVIEELRDVTFEGFMEYLREQC